LPSLYTEYPCSLLAHPISFNTLLTVYTSYATLRTSSEKKKKKKIPRNCGEYRILHVGLIATAISAGIKPTSCTPDPRMNPESPRTLHLNLTSPYSRFFSDVTSYNQQPVRVLQTDTHSPPRTPYPIFTESADSASLTVIRFPHRTHSPSAIHAPKKMD
jgi:hypothetical protein